MADTDGITEFQSFTERTLKYGRNLMAIAVPIVVFYFVPLVDLAKSRPFNFEIKQGGEIYIWGLFLVLLVYYGARFSGLAIPDFLQWQEMYGHRRAAKKNSLDQEIRENKTKIIALAHARLASDEVAIPALEANVKGTQINVKKARSTYIDYNWRRTYFWIADAGLPTGLFGLALWASIVKILIPYCLDTP